MQGTLANLFSPNRDWDFQQGATNQAVVANWTELAAGYSAHAQAAVNIDLSACLDNLLSDIKQAGQVISEVIEVIGAIAGA